jgi:hypothetical protein
MQSEHESDMSAMQEKRTALETWAKQNNIDSSYLMGGFGKKGHMRMR